MMMMWFTFCLFFQPVEKEVVFLIQKNEVVDNLGNVAINEQRIWLGRHRIRADVSKGSITLIYDMDVELLIFVDHGDQSFVISKASGDKQSLRMSLVGLSPLVNGVLQRSPPYTKAVSEKKVIQGYHCQKFQLDYPEHYGVKTDLWSAYHPVLLPAIYKRLWFASLGTSPPSDVRFVLNNLLREINGIPMRISTRIEMDDYSNTMTTTIVHVEKQINPDPATFNIPNGYKMVRLEQK